MKYLFKYIKYEPWRVSLVIVLQTICSLFRVANSVLNVYILNSLVKFDLKAFMFYILLNIAVFVVMTVFVFFDQIEQVRTIQYLSLHLKQDVITHLSKYPIKKFQEQDTGVYASWLTNDMNLIEGSGFGNLFQSIQIITDPLFSIIVLIKFHWTFLPLVLLMTILTIFLPQLIRKKLATSNLSTTKENEKVLNVINDSLRGFSTLAIFGMAQQLEKRITSATMKLIGAKVHQAKFSTFAECIAQFSNIMAQMAITAWTGFLVFQRAVSVGVFSSAANLSFNVFNSLAAAAPILAEMRSLDPVFEKYHLDDTDDVENETATVETQLISPVTITAEKLQTSYQPGKAIFAKPLTFSIPAGEKVAIYGDSGSGKSTLLKLLSGQLRDYQGRLQLNQSDMRKLSYAAIRDKVIYIDQSPYLFNDTIRYNLELGQKFSENELMAALDKADLLGFIDQLPQKLKTPVGEGGTSLSGGQRQRLALARGLLRQKELFLLDESTSSLDKASAIKVENDFLSQPKITVVFVSHQLHSENKDKFDQMIRV